MSARQVALNAGDLTGRGHHEYHQNVRRFLNEYLCHSQMTVSCSFDLALPQQHLDVPANAVL